MTLPDEAIFRKAMSHLATGVSVVTAKGVDGEHGAIRPILDDDGVETGSYEVPAGGRRFRALELLVKQKKLAKTAPVPCVVREAGSAILAEEDSLAENVQRVALHPLDQFRAFRDMLEKGMSEEEIAAAFFVAPCVVKQRLRLMTVSDMVLASGRYAMIDDGLQFQLVPWTPSLEKQQGRHVSGVARGDGGIDWSFTRNRGLGL
jgi:hypothetical protein